MSKTVFAAILIASSFAFAASVAEAQDQKPMPEEKPMHHMHHHHHHYMHHHHHHHHHMHHDEMMKPDKGM